jgi:hypothetical protein
MRQQIGRVRETHDDRTAVGAGGPRRAESGRGTRSRRLLALGWGPGLAVALLALIVVPSLAGAHAGAGVRTLGTSTADSQQSVATNFSGNFTITKISVVHNVTYFVATTVRTLSGNMSGVFVAYEWGAIQANGSVWISGIGTFVGTILGGAPGIAEISWQKATGTFGVSVSGSIHLSDGEKGLLGVHGDGIATVYFTGGSGFDGNYALSLDMK